MLKEPGAWQCMHIGTFAQILEGFKQGHLVADPQRSGLRRRCGRLGDLSHVTAAALLPLVVYCRLCSGAAALLDGIQLSTFSWAALHSHA
jgi:hypothetical protein